MIGPDFFIRRQPVKMKSKDPIIVRKVVKEEAKEEKEEKNREAKRGYLKKINLKIPKNREILNEKLKKIAIALWRQI